VVGSRFAHTLETCEHSRHGDAVVMYGFDS
jgi:hypothetical protein